MNKEWEIKLQEDFPFMQQNNVEGEVNIYNTCEICGAEGELRNDSGVGVFWLRTLCEVCHKERLKEAAET